MTAHVRDWAPRYHEYAALAAIAYGAGTGVATPPGWAKSANPQDTVDDRASGLYFEVWEKTAGSVAEVAVVFRGTSEPKDWWSNARFITRYVPIGWDQYDQVRRLIAGVVDRAKARHGQRLRMVTVGHSLGGGLAQQAAYAHPGIKQVFAFDSSPLTGYQSVPVAERAINQRGIRIDRVYEKGEILAYVRGFLREWKLPLSVKDPEIVEVRFNFSRGKSVQQHSMIQLALDLAAAAAPGNSAIATAS